MDPEVYYGDDYDTDEDESISGPEEEANVDPEKNGTNSDAVENESYLDPVEQEASVEQMEDESNGDCENFIAQALTTEQIIRYMVDCIRKVNSLIQIPATTTLILLNHFRWDKIQLIERFYEVDQDTLFAEAGIANPMKGLNKAVLPKDNEENECGICCELKLHSSFLTGLECNHRFCKDCWCKYLTTKIMEDGVGEMITCAAYGCDILVDEASVMRFVSDPKVRRKYQFLVANSFVTSNRFLRWCPSPDCSYAIRVQHVDDSMQRVKCKCGHAFCFSCGEAWHDPLTCSMLKKWLARIQEDAETSSWIATHTKGCPRCNATIEKNGGCNHMKCHRCRFDFCWSCSADLKKLSHACLRPPSPDAISDKFSFAERKESVLQKYLFYCRRFVSHKNSLKLERELYASAREKIKDLQQDGKSWMQEQYLKQAVDVLCQCRQTLMYTYGFAFYLRKNNQSIIFENNQKDMENAVEKLSEYLEQEVRSSKGNETKRKLQDKVEYCRARRKVLLEHVHEGNENNWWEYSHLLECKEIY